MKQNKIYFLFLSVALIVVILLNACESHRMAPAYGDGGGGRSYRGSVFKTKETGSTTGWSYDGSSDGGFERSPGKEDGKVIDGVFVKEHTATTATKPKARSGLLTATEINDFSKWELWGDYVKTELNTHQKTWKINPYTRYLVQLENEAGKPLQGATVTLLNGKNDILWQAVSDNTGKAQLWSGFIPDKNDSIVSSIKIGYKEISEVIPNPVPFEKGVNHKKNKN